MSQSSVLQSWIGSFGMKLNHEPHETCSAPSLWKSAVINTELLGHGSRSHEGARIAHQSSSRGRSGCWC